MLPATFITIWRFLKFPSFPMFGSVPPSLHVTVHINYRVYVTNMYAHSPHHLPKKVTKKPSVNHIGSSTSHQQESPPAWTQQEYRPPRIKHSICCPIPRVGGYPIPDWGHTPIAGWGTPLFWPYNGGYPIPGQGTPIWTWLRYPPPPRKDMGPVEVLWDGEGVLLRKDMGPEEVFWDGDRVLSSGVDWQTNCIYYLPHPWDAAGKNVMKWEWK